MAEEQHADTVPCQRRRQGPSRHPIPGSKPGVTHGPAVKSHIHGFCIGGESKLLYVAAYQVAVLGEVVAAAGPVNRDVKGLAVGVIDLHVSELQRHFLACWSLGEKDVRSDMLVYCRVSSMGLTSMHILITCNMFFIYFYI